MKNKKTVVSVLLMFIVLVSGVVCGVTNNSSKSNKEDAQLAPITCIVYKSIASSIDSSAEILLDLYRIKKNPYNKALFLFIDSRGGGLASSELIMNALKDIRQIMPVVAFIENQGMSSAYMIASAADWIFAQQLSEVGSIGVARYDSFSKQEEFIYLTSGMYKRAYRDLAGGFNQTVVDYEQEQMNLYGEILFQIIADNRQLPIEQIRAQEARSYSGRQALEKGLVDQIGSIDQAIEKILELITARGGAVEDRIVLVDCKGELLTEIR